MSQLTIGSNIISSDIIKIISKIRRETSYIKDYKNKSGQDYIFITCPFHKDGKESNPSCSINISVENDLPFGTFHCFTCGESGQLYNLINKCYNYPNNDYFGQQWLVDNFSNYYFEDSQRLILQPLISENKQDLSLDKFNFTDSTPAYEYLINKRHLSKDVISYFRIAYDKDTNSVVFPVWDISGNLVLITKRSIDSHKFNISKQKQKPVYLLNEVVKNNYTTVIICESQINALTCWTFGYPAIALLGTGTAFQIDQINKSGVRNVILMFDGDDAGKRGGIKMIKNLNKSILKTEVILPKGKDVNDLTYEEFKSLLNSGNFVF